MHNRSHRYGDQSASAFTANVSATGTQELSRLRGRNRVAQLPRSLTRLAAGLRKHALAHIAIALSVTAAIGASSASASPTRLYLSSFGAFLSVQGVAIEQDSGDVYIYDGGGEAVYKFDGVGNPVDFTSTATNKITDVPYAGGGEGEIAVDSSTGPAKGDIYVAHASNENVLVYNAAGQKVGEITEESGSPWGEACGVAVGSSGEIYVGLYPSTVNEYRPTSAVVSNSDYVGSYEGVTSACNVAADPAGNLYVDSWSSGPIVSLAPSQLGRLATGTVIDESGSTVAVDPASEDVFADEQDQISEFGPNGKPAEAPLLVFAAAGPGALEGSVGLAVSEKSNEVFAASGKGAVNVYGSPVIVPGAKTKPATGIEIESATAHGEVNPEGLAVEECYFEYGDSTNYGEKAPCVESEGEIGTGTGYLAVHAELTGLTPGIEYHFRLVAANENGPAAGSDASFTYLIQKVESVFAIDVTGTSATLGGSLNPHGTPTEYFFEYGPTSSYGTTTATHEALGETVQPVQAHIDELLPGTTYHYRLVTNSARGPAEGQDLTFTTEGIGGPLQLLDGRQWELVSPPVKHGADVHKEGIEGGGTIVQAAASGDAITYVSENPITEEPEGNGAPEPSQELSRRGADGTWSTRTLDVKNEETHGLPAGEGFTYWLFNPELTLAVLMDYGHTPLAPDATDESAPYLRDEAACNDGSSSCFTPFLTRENTKPGAKWDARTRLAGATEDLKYTVISSEAPLTEGAVETEYALGELYEWSEGHLMNVSINVAGESVAGRLGGNGQASVRGAISNDGSRVFWCEIECRGTFASSALLMRDTATEETVRIDQATDRRGEFQIATEDGSRVFYAMENPGEYGEPQLWECTLVEVAGNLECERTEVAPEIEGIVSGINGDGTTVYFVSSAALSTGAEAGGNNLYVSHLENGKWVPRLIATLDPSHNGFGEDDGDMNDWGGQNNLTESMTTRVSPNGRYLAFMSDRSLTGYDNHDAISGEPDEEVFLYDDQDDKLACASCSKSGARPEGMRLDEANGELLIDSHGELRERWVAADIPTWESSAVDDAVHQPRYLSNEGRLFFNSVAPLVPQDTNGLADVYEYEPEEVGSCADAGGCVQLISSGASGEESAFVEASENGNDAFFITAAKLTPQDTDTEYDIYDARICTPAVPCVQAPVTPPPCDNGESCKAAPTPQPSIFGAPASETFTGAGNPASPTSAPTAKAKPLTRARKLAKALRACRKDKSKSRRNGCERQARKRYGSKPKAKAKSRRAKAHEGGK
jgi:hypothetical protein